MGPIFRLTVDGGRPVQLAEHHAGGPLQVQAAGGPQGNAAQIGMARHEALYAALLHGGRFSAGDKSGREALQLPLVNVHHLMMMGEEQHLFAALQQRPDELGDGGSLGNARGLPFPPLYFHFPQGALGGVCVGGFPHQAKGLVHRLHQAAVDALVAVDGHDQAALGRQFLQHLLLGAAQHQPLGTQMLAQQLRLLYDAVAIAVAPFPGKAFVIPQHVEVQNVHHVPDLRTLIIDGRAAQAHHPLGRLGQQTGSGILLRARMAQLLNLVKNDRGKAHVRQGFLPAPQEQIVHQINIRRRQSIGLQAADHMHPQGRAVGLLYEAGDLVFPVAHQMGRGHHDGGIGPGLAQPRQRLHRFAQPHLVRQQAAVGAQQKRQSLLLEVGQLPPEYGGVGLHLLRHPAGQLLVDGIVPCLLQRLFPALLIGGLHQQGIAQHQPVQVAHHPPVGREPRFAPPGRGAAGKQPLAQLRHHGVALHRPAFPPGVVAQGAVGALGLAFRALRAVRIHQIGRQQIEVLIFFHKREPPSVLLQGRATPHSWFRVI